jgi:hypothetical protein
MKKRITLSIDGDLYDQIEALPRKVSISEMVNWFLHVALEELKEGRELTTEELRNKAKQIGGEELLQRMDDRLGPKVDKMMEILTSIKSTLTKDNDSEK